MGRSALKGREGGGGGVAKFYQRNQPRMKAAERKRGRALEKHSSPPTTVTLAVLLTAWVSPPCHLRHIRKQDKRHHARPSLLSTMYRGRLH